MERITKDLVDENVIIFKEKVVNETNGCTFQKYIHNENKDRIIVLNKKIIYKFIELYIDNTFEHYLLIGYDGYVFVCKSEWELLKELEVYKKDGYLTAR